MENRRNEFGEGIPYRKGEPIQLLKYIPNEKNPNKYGKIIMNQEALNIITKIDEPVSIIAVVGSYRRGKSWFANLLHGRHDGFMLGSTVVGCTQGIYMWNKPFYHQGKRVIVLDCEGIDDPKQNQQWAVRLFILCLTISSTFIYNLNGVVGREDIGKLFLMTNLTKFIKPPSDYKFLPRMVVLLRDFMLKNPNSFEDYFLEGLSNVNEEAAKGIKKHFSEFNVFGLPIPATDRTQIQNLDKVSTVDLQPDFVNEVTKTVKSILATSAPKYIGSSTMSGSSFTKFLQECVKKLNDTSDSSHFQLSIPDEYESVVEYVAQRSIEYCIQMYVSNMKLELRYNKEEDDDFDDFQHINIFNWKDFNEIHLGVFSRVEEEFFKRIIGNESQIKDYEGNLNKLINREFEEFRRANSESLHEYNMELAKQLWDTHVRAGLTAGYCFKTQEEFNNAIAVFEREILDSLLNCPETEMIMAKFKSREYQDAITMLKSIGVLRSELADQFKSVQESERKYLEYIAKENELQIKYDKLKSEHKQIEKRLNEKIRKLDENVEQQKITNIEILQQIQHYRDLSLALLKSEKESELANLRKQINEVKQDKEGWINLIKTLTPLLQIGFKFVSSIFLSKYNL